MEPHPLGRVPPNEVFQLIITESKKAFHIFVNTPHLLEHQGRSVDNQMAIVPAVPGIDRSGNPIIRGEPVGAGGKPVPEGLY